MSCVDVDIDERRSGGNVRRVARVRRRCFPDGESWMEQEVIVAEAFSLMANEVREVVRRG